MWIGFGLLMAGVLIATVGRRGAKRKLADGTAAPADADAEAEVETAEKPEPEKVEA